jgi:hypothetical protein
MATPSPQLRRLGTAPRSGWPVFSLGTPDPDSIPTTLQLPSEKFVCLLAWNASHASVDAIAKVAEKLLNLGCVYFCCWGRDCERVHDIIDEVVVGDGTLNVAWLNIMTTCHADKPIAEAVDFFLDFACPDEMHLDKCGTAVALTIGDDYQVASVELAVSVKLLVPPSNPPLNRTAQKRAAG